MEKQQKNDEGRDMARNAPKPVAKNVNKGKVPASLGNTGDPFIRDMQNIADDNALDGNAQINSPQATANEEGSPGTSR
jgi:hypothetical protein